MSVAGDDVCRAICEDIIFDQILQQLSSAAARSQLLQLMGEGDAGHQIAQGIEATDVLGLVQQRALEGPIVEPVDQIAAHLDDRLEQAGGAGLIAISLDDEHPVPQAGEHGVTVTNASHSVHQAVVRRAACRAVAGQDGPSAQ